MTMQAQVCPHVERSRAGLHTFHILGIARGLLRGPEQPAHHAQEHEVDDVPEVAGYPIDLPALVILVCHLHPV